MHSTLNPMRWCRWTVGGCLVSTVLWASSPSADSALERLARGDAVGARRDYEQLLARRPDDARLSFNAAVAAHRQGDWEAAARHYESALASDNLQLQQRAFFGLGNTRFRQGETAEDPADKTRMWEDAVRHYQASLGLDATDRDARGNLEAVQQELARMQKDPKDQKKQKDDKQEKDPKDSKDDKEKDKDSEGQDGKDDPKDSKDGEKKDGGKKSKPSPDSKQNGMGSPDAGKDKGDPGKDGKPGEKNGQDSQAGKEGQDGKGGDPSKPDKGSGKAGDGKPGDPKEGSAGEGGQGDPQGKPATGGATGSAADPAEDSADGRMAIRFAERLLDGHKQDEKALIWRPASPSREQRAGGGRRKTW
jgi:hypothetical protein